MRPPSHFLGAQVTKWLMISCIAIYFLDGMLADNPRLIGPLTAYGLFSIADVFSEFQVWRLLSFQFLHGSGGHLLSNMIGLYFFGPLVERLMGSKRYLIYYLLCGVGGALFYTLLVGIGWLDAGWMVGASAGIFGILVALIVVAPDLRVSLILMTNTISMRALGCIYLGISVLVVLTNGHNAGGEAGHLGGALIGFLLMKQPWLMGAGTAGKFGGKPGRAKVVREVKIRPRTMINLDSDEVDRILDKVSAHGVHSLTEKERALLLRVKQNFENHE